jgi:DNA-binding SARP family transcriptional activator/predicted ATPase
LGPLEIVAGGGPVALGGTKARALLAFLILHRGEVVPRERVVDELWGERPPKTVAAELRVYVAKLRKALGPDLIATRADGYALVTADETVDAARFERAARHGSGLLAAGDAEAAARVLADALALWRGPLLADLSTEPWLQGEARRLEELRLEAVEERLEAELAIGRHTGVVAELERLMVEHPYRERLRALVMLALYRSGRHAEALAAYGDFRRLIREELGLDPSPALQRLERKVLNHDLELDPAKAEGLQTSPAREHADHRFPGIALRETAPFVGREAALKELHDDLRRALRGRSQIRFVQGEAGSGKTALLSEFVRLADREDPRLIVVGGQCPPHTGTTDLYAPFRQVFGMLVGDLQTALATGVHPPDHARRLWAGSESAIATLLDHGPHLVDALVPARAIFARAQSVDRGLAARVDEFLKSPAADNEARRSPPGQIRDEAIIVLDRLARLRPVVLLLDDLQWADPSTLDLLARLVEPRAGAQLAVVGAFRPEDIETSRRRSRDTWRRLLNDVKRQHGDVVVDLDQAAAVEARSFIDTLLDQEPNRLGEQFRKHLTEHSQGHAMFAVETIRELQESGDLRRDGKGRWVQSPDIAWDRWPARIEGLLAERFRRLDDQTLEMLRVASAEGEEFTADVVAAVQRLSLETVVESLSAQAIARHRLLRASGAQQIAGRRVLRYRFRHNLYQRFLYDRLDASRRSLLHERIGSVLEGLGAAAHDEFALSLAHHFDRGGIGERAVGYFTRAGLRAMRLSANEQAVEHFNRAIALVESSTGGEERDGVEASLQLHRGIALQALRGFGAPEVEEAYARATELTMGGALTPEELPIHFGLWMFHSARGNYARSTRLVERMTDLASDRDESLQLQALHARWADCHMRGWLDAAVSAAQEGSAIYRPDSHHVLTFRYGNHDPGVCALAVKGLALALQGESTRATRAAREAVQLSEVLGHSFTRAHARSLQSWVLQLSNGVEVALREAEAALSLEAEVDAPYFFAVARAVRGWALSSIGRYDEGVAELEVALATQVAAAADPYAAMTSTFLAEAHLRHSRRDPARAAVHQMLSLSDPIGRYVYTPEILRVEAEWLVLEDRADEASRLLLQAVDTAREQGSWVMALRAAVELARMRSAEHESNLRLLAEVVNRVPAECRLRELEEARVLLGRSVAEAMP